jgi:glycerol kinase
LGWLRDIRLIDDPRDLDGLGGAAADTGGAVFVPALAGLAAPFWRPAARATFAGLALSTSRAQLVRAVVEGIAAQVAWLAHAAAADLEHPLARLRVDGGLTRSHTLMQTQADLLQVPVEVYPSPHATALGVAALARLGCGGAADAAAAVGTWQPAAVFEPRISADEAESRLHRWRRVAEATMDV